jgi:hypothetical protein
VKLKVSAGGDPYYLLEGAGEMTLIEKSRVDSRARYGASLKKKLFGPFYSRLDDILMR